MTRKGWTLFVAMSVIWGMPYLFIKIAVEDLEPAFVVFARTAIAGVALLAIAAARGQLRSPLRRWRWLLVFAAVEMIVPWLMLTNAEVHLPSGLTGLLVACVPLVAVLVAYLLGDHHALRPIRLAGIAVGMGGVALIVGGDLNAEGGVPWLAIMQVMIVCVGYAIGPFVVDRRLKGEPSLGVNALSLCVAAVAVSPLAWVDRPHEMPPADALWSVIGLAVICTGIAFIVFFALIEEVGPDRATLITFANPAVALLLGVVFLDERLTAATAGGFLLVMAGCWLATRPAVRAEAPLADAALRR